MGLPAMPDTPEDNFNGDSRQRALWALEGKKSQPSTSSSGLVFGFSKVEIPEWKSPEAEREEYARSSSPFSSSGAFVCRRRRRRRGSRRP